MTDPYRSFTMMLASFVVIFGAVLSFTSYWFVSHELIRENGRLTRDVVAKYVTSPSHADRLFYSSTDTGRADDANISASRKEAGGTFDSDMHATFDSYSILDVRIMDRNGQIRFSYDDSEWHQALTGHEREQFERTVRSGQMLTDKRSGNLKLWIPLSSSSGALIGVAEVSKDWSAQRAKIVSISLTIMLITAIGMLLLFFGLRHIFLRSSRVIERQKSELGHMLDRVHRTYDESLQALSSALDSRDNETQGHSLRVTAYAWLLARQMGVEGQELEMLYRGALLHDVGKIGIPDAILRKEGPLDEMEWAIMRTHVNMGVRMLAHIDFLGPALDVVRCHHERWDGLGYPEGLRGEEIPLSARIFAVCDTYDAITSDRPYRASKSHETAIAELRKFAGSQFCPDVVAAFMTIPSSTLQRVRDLSQQEGNNFSLEDLMPSVS